MEIGKLLLPQQFETIGDLKQLQKLSEGFGQDKEKAVSELKKFESIFIMKLLEQMENTAGEWGFEKDESDKQVNNIFSLSLADELAQSGGFGIWEQLYKSLVQSSEVGPTNTLDSAI